MTQNTLYNRHGGNLSLPMVDTSRKILDFSPITDSLAKVGGAKEKEKRKEAKGYQDAAKKTDEADKKQKAEKAKQQQAFNEKRAKQQQELYSLELSILLEDSMEQCYQMNRNDVQGFSDAFGAVVNNVFKNVPDDLKLKAFAKINSKKLSYVDKITNNQIAADDARTKEATGERLNQVRQQATETFKNLSYAYLTNNKQGVSEFKQSLSQQRGILNALSDVRTFNDAKVLTEKDLKAIENNSVGAVDGFQRALNDMSYESRAKAYDSFKDRERFMFETGIDDETYDAIDRNFKNLLDDDKKAVAKQRHSNAVLSVIGAYNAGFSPDKLRESGQWQNLTTADKENVKKIDEILQKTKPTEKDFNDLESIVFSKRDFQDLILSAKTWGIMAKGLSAGNIEETSSNALRVFADYLSKREKAGGLTREQAQKAALKAGDLYSDSYLTKTLATYSGIIDDQLDGIDDSSDFSDELYAISKQENTKDYISALNKKAGLVFAQMMQQAIEDYRATGDQDVLDDRLQEALIQAGRIRASFLFASDKEMNALEVGGLVRYNGVVYKYRGTAQDGTMLFDKE